MAEVKTITEAQVDLVEAYVELKEEFASISANYNRLESELISAENQLIDELGIDGVKTVTIAGTTFSCKTKRTTIDPSKEKAITKLLDGIKVGLSDKCKKFDLSLVKKYLSPEELKKVTKVTEGKIRVTRNLK